MPAHSSRAFLEVTLQTARANEEAAQRLLESVLGKPASIYAPEESASSAISVFLENPGDWSPAREKALRSGLRKLGPATLSTHKLRAQDWAESWKRHFKPIRIGQSLLVKPSWSRPPRVPGQAIVVLDPGLSFGTGQHATTRFCLEELVRGRPQGTGRSFLDIGCGSGILSIAAAKIGYDPVRAFDFDPAAVRIARQNARSNHVSIRIERVDLTEMPVSSRQKFDTICANLTYDLLLGNAERIINRLSPGGSLILAGILQTQFEQVKNCYQRLGFTLKKSRTVREWRSGHFLQKQ